MQTTTISLLLLALLVAVALSYYQYLSSPASKGRINYLLAGLRCLSFFVLFLLLLNPVLKKRSSEIEKQDLLLLVDHSRSMLLGEQLNLSDSILTLFRENQSLQDRFELRTFLFGESLMPGDSVSTFADATDINRSLAELLRAYRTDEGAVILLTDGKQTYGEDYGFREYSTEMAIFPIVLGDTTRYADLAIERVNHNSLAFLNNSFPIEIFISYDGTQTVRTTLEIYQDGKLIRRRNLEFSPVSPSSVLTENLNAAKTGLSRIELRLTGMEGERNLVNNKKELAVEVLDEKTQIAIVSNVVHPDLGVLKKSITSNPQREVSILTTDELRDASDFDLFVLYNPDERFRQLHERLLDQKAGIMVVAGPGVDWDYLNTIQNRYSYEVLDEGPVEARAILNPTFSRFDISGFDPGEYPPVASSLGDMLITVSSENLLDQKVRGVETGEPILVAMDKDEQKELLWMGNGFWKWRLENFRKEGSFEKFDSFVDKLIRYLAEGVDRERLQLRYNPVFQDNRSALMSAVFLDEALEFDASAELQLILRDSTGRQRVLPMPLLQTRYQADLSDVPAGEYDFKVEVVGNDISKEGSFRILDLDLEGQLVRTPFEKLGSLAEAHDGNLYFPEETGGLVEHLMKDPGFSPILRTRQNVVSLISFPWLLAVLITSLATEWFIRKYNGYN